jgi:uncharacterized protein (DUF488 family)
LKHRQDNSHFFTLGYQKLSERSLLNILRANGIQVLIDVRRNAVSRKPGFSKQALETALTKAGIEYVHLPTLGTPPTIRDYYCRVGNVELALERYGQYLASRKDRLKLLMNVVASRTYCLLCLESDPASCHRSVLAEELEKLTKCRAIHLV